MRRLRLWSRSASLARERSSLRRRKDLIEKASWDLAQRFPRLLGLDSLPFTLGGVHKWQFDAYPDGEMPPIDVSFEGEGFFFSFLPPSETRRIRHARHPQPAPWSPELLEQSLQTPPRTRRQILEEAFRRKLRLSSDVQASLPIFLDPARVLLARDSEDLTSYLDLSWHEALLWGLRQLPPMPEGELLSGTWASRRAYLEEASRHSLFA